MVSRQYSAGADGTSLTNVLQGLTNVSVCVTVFETTEQDKGSAQENGGELENRLPKE